MYTLPRFASSFCGVSLSGALANKRRVARWAFFFRCFEVTDPPHHRPPTPPFPPLFWLIIGSCFGDHLPFEGGGGSSARKFVVSPADIFDSLCASLLSWNSVYNHFPPRCFAASSLWSWETSNSSSRVTRVVLLVP